ncbi:MAG: hypothetical protein IJE91_05015 [Clostridia bacterium]|nr:hypothetical protein [Clostridia bacterium]
MAQINEDAIKKLISSDFVAYTHAQNCEAVMSYVRAKNSAMAGGMQNIDDGRTIYVIVGPSGSGKTTVIANLYNAGLLGSPDGKFVPYVNRFQLPVTDGPIPTLEEEIAFKAELLERGKSFVVESAQFDENYREFIKIAKLKYGYNICMLYLTKTKPEENIEMVEKRKKQGGHGRANVELDPQVLAEMYKTDSENLVEILPYCDSCFVIKNTTIENENDKPVILMQKKLDGTIEYDPRYKYAKFLCESILQTGPIRIRRAKVPKTFKSAALSKGTLKRFNVRGGHKAYVKRRITQVMSRFTKTLSERELDDISKYPPEVIDLILRGGRGKK